jgi:hypothetical protein
MNEIKLTWTQFKDRLDGNPLNYTESGASYYIWFITGAGHFSCYLQADDIADFEANYKSAGNSTITGQNKDGHNIVSIDQGHFYGDLKPQAKGYSFTATAGETTFYDIPVTSQVRMFGGVYWICNPQDVEDQDLIEFSVIDKDDTLGYFTALGLTVGVDILELNKYYKNGYVKKGNPAEGYKYRPLERNPAAVDVLAGLYFRTTYQSSGSVDIEVIQEIEYGEY